MIVGTIPCPTIPCPMDVPAAQEVVDQDTIRDIRSDVDGNA